MEKLKLFSMFYAAEVGFRSVGPDCGVNNGYAGLKLSVHMFPEMP